MSNVALVERIRKVVAEFQAGRAPFVHLQDVLENTTSALEALPYSLLIQLRGIKSRLAIEQSYDEEDCQTSFGTALADLEQWLRQVPTDV